MKNWLQRLHPFKTAEARRLAILFAIVYFAQGMAALPNQVIAINFKDQGFEADDVAAFFLVASIPWFIKPLYGLISDFVPLFGQRRKSYLIVTSALACMAGLVAGLSANYSYWELALLYTIMGFGLAYNDVLTDALMVEKGKLSGLTGAFQSVQWTAITAASIIVGLLGGYFAEYRQLQAAFTVAALFPLVVLLMAGFFVREKRINPRKREFKAIWTALRSGFGERSVWLVGAFIFLFNFSPSFGPAFLYYQIDVLGFNQQYIGFLNAVDSAASILGALIYAPLARSTPLRRLINFAIGLSVITLLTYLGYMGEFSALLIHVIWGIAGMITTLAFLDLAARACPRRAEATFFALLMAIFNLGTLASQNVGAHLYTELGEGSFAYIWLVVISSFATAAIWLLVPMIHIERIEARAQRRHR
ncbi:putative MFS family arabinose efflux permease [Nitrosomonas sp. Nm84]|uniref:folate/biopterin family MFS transporter n=1 Tax=Nitrosomonas sp. Nm84 TaxID=200124 RepID=UPI000D774BB5|nr:folate/biopterin family MFS transporter [Nitrosomonas sp. Nm84]PXW91220.1 putative MFS family arabinose efflux permease [Nitrosomonas sp. Nm84]